MNPLWVLELVIMVILVLTSLPFMSHHWVPEYEIVLFSILILKKDPSVSYHWVA